MDRDVIGAINIGLRYLSTDERGMALPSTEPLRGAGEAVDPAPRANPLTELKLSNIGNTVRGETLYLESQKTQPRILR